jgi:hypothetical protein
MRTSPKPGAPPPPRDRALAMPHSSGGRTAERGYTVPVAREMTPAETEAQRRLVRASVLATRS